MSKLLTLAGALSAFASLGWVRAQRSPLRVGLLNTGELILVDDTDQAQVLSAPTTALIREQLIHTDIAASELLLFPQGPTVADELQARRQGS